MSDVPASNRHLIRRLIALAWRHRWGCLRLLLLQVLVLGMGLAGLGLVGLTVDLIQSAARPGSPPPAWPGGFNPTQGLPPLTAISVLAVLVLALALVRAAVNYSYSVAAAELVQGRIVVELRAAVYEKLQRLSFRFFSANASGSIINRVTSDVQSVRLFIDGVILQMIVLVVSLVFYLAYMLHIHAGLTLVCLATTPLLWWLSARFSRTVRPAYDRNRALVDRMLLTLSENVRGVQVVKGFGREPEEQAKFRRANQAVKEQQHWIFWRVSLFTPSIEFLMSLNLAVLLLAGGWLVIDGQLPLGSGLIVFSGLLQQFSGQVAKITSIVNSVQQSLAGARRVFEVLDAPLEVHSPPAAQRLGRAEGGLEFEHVWFEYERGEPVLQDIDLTIAPGECLAILGATGQGKTTLLNLLPRFYDATAGRVRIDGIDVRDMDLDDLRRNIGIVFQENFLFSDTVAANIAFGHPGATLEQVVRAAKIAAAHDFIVQLPHGYNTVLHEGGKDLSGGQRQRLAIARALLLEPPILLMDDPTAAIDPHTEQEILDALETVIAGRTTLVVAHRISTLRRADRVVVLHDGRIVEVGTHDELMARGGHYWQAVQLQSSQEPRPAPVFNVLGVELPVAPLPESGAPGPTPLAPLAPQPLLSGHPAAHDSLPTP